MEIANELRIYDVMHVHSLILFTFIVIFTYFNNFKMVAILRGVRYMEWVGFATF